jgi:hypothetical protein
MKTLFISQELWDLLEKYYIETNVSTNTQGSSEERCQGVVFHLTSCG